MEGRCEEKINTARRAVHVSSRISRASQLHVSSSEFLVMRFLTTSIIKVDNRVRVPKGLNIVIKEKRIQFNNIPAHHSP